MAGARREKCRETDERFVHPVHPVHQVHSVHSVHLFPSAKIYFPLKNPTQLTQTLSPNHLHVTHT